MMLNDLDKQFNEFPQFLQSLQTRARLKQIVATSRQFSVLFLTKSLRLCMYLAVLTLYVLSCSLIRLMLFIAIAIFSSTLFSQQIFNAFSQQCRDYSTLFIFLQIVPSQLQLSPIDSCQCLSNDLFIYNACTKQFSAFQYCPASLSQTAIL